MLSKMRAPADGGSRTLPDQLFYNTGISTYICVLSNRKEKPAARARSSSSTPGVFS